MAIEKMKRLRLVAVKSEREMLLNEMMFLGCVHISEPEDPDPGSLEAILFTKGASELGKLKAEYETLTAGLEILNKYAFVKRGLFTPKPEVSVQSVMDDSSLDESLSIARMLSDSEEKIRRLLAKESRLKGLIETLTPWETLDLSFERIETKTCFITTGLIPATVKLDLLEVELYAKVSESQIVEVSSDKNAHYILLVAMKADKSLVMELVRQFGFSPSSTSGLSGTAGENIKTLGTKLNELEREKEQLAEKITAAAAFRDNLELCADRLLTKTGRAENAERLLCTEATVCLEGWVPDRMEKRLGNMLANFACAWETEYPTEMDTPNVPIKLRNNALTSPFTMLTEMYSLPAYNGLDPNPFLALFFPMFFGIMLADLGYGILLFLGGLIYKLKAKPRGGQSYVAGLLMICGIATAVFGVLTGSFFGDAITKLSGMYGNPIAVPALIDPLNNPLQVLIGALIIGLVQLILGTAINGYILIRDGKWVDAICDVGSIWMLLAGVALGALGVTWYLVYAGVLMVVLTQGRTSPSIGGKIGNGLFSLYSLASGWFGDILSYCRLMALMLAGAVIASVFNTLGTLAGNLIVFIILFLIGHTLNLGLNLIGAFVHSLRLQYLEFFGKFYREGGKPFRPLAIKTNYFNIIEED